MNFTKYQVLQLVGLRIVISPKRN